MCIRDRADAALILTAHRAMDVERVLAAVSYTHLHRISGIRNRKGQVIGLTLRVGRAVFGTVEIIRDIIAAGRSVLLLEMCIRDSR